MQMTSPALLADLYIYPVKSMAGIRLAAAELDAFGLRHDRRWMLVDDAGVFKTQRKTPRMALMRATITSSGLTLDAPGMPSLAVETPSVGAARVAVSVWNDQVEALRAAAEVDAWCSEFLGMACHLVHMPDDVLRPVNAPYGTEGERVHFGDGFPLLVISQASLDDLNERLTAVNEMAVPMNRFRPNIVIEGTPPYAEDRWQQIHISGEGGADVSLRVVKPCARCVMTTIDQNTAAGSKEPLRTLATYRKQGTAVMFGQNAIHETVGATLRVGAPVTVVTTT